VANNRQDILLLTDSAGGAIAQDLDILYPNRVRKLNFTAEKVTASALGELGQVITVVGSGENVSKLNYRGLTAYARRGGQVMSCLFEYAHHRGLHFSKTHVIDRVRPAMRIDAESDVTKGFSVGDEIWWFGCVSSAADPMYANQMYQRQVMGVQESDDVRILGTSNLNGGAVMIEERVGQGRIVALDMLSPGRPFFNAWGSTNKYLFLGNQVNQAVRYGKHYPKRLSYDELVDAMRDLVAQHPQIRLQPEGPCSDGREMWTLNLGDEERPTLYFGGSIHGWEWENSYGLLHLAELLAQDSHLEGLDTTQFHFKIMPVQNPWGHDHFTRQNARGVDLNRNFDSGWDQFPMVQDVAVPWDYNYKGPRAASERETRIVQGIIDRHRPIGILDFHTADYVLLRPYRGEDRLMEAIHANIKARLKDRYLCQRPYGGPYQQVNMDRVSAAPSDPRPYLIDYGAKQGAAASVLIEMSGNRDDVHALVMNVDTVVETCLAMVEECLKWHCGR